MPQGSGPRPLDPRLLMASTNPGFWARRCVSTSASQKLLLPVSALPFLELCSINNNYDGAQDTCAMRFNRSHFTWMSGKFQGRRMTMKHLFRKLKNRQGWETRGGSVKRYLLWGWRGSKIPLSKEMSPGCPESQPAALLTAPSTAPSPSSAQKWAGNGFRGRGEAESRALLDASWK